jgi:hypothetical protein
MHETEGVRCARFCLQCEPCDLGKHAELSQVESVGQERLDPAPILSTTR